MPPDCVNQIIEDINESDVTNPPKKVFSLSFEGKTYYYVTAPCCDFFTELYDEDCNLICAPDGGISGSGSGTCPEGFEINEIEKELIFEDQR